MSVTRPRSFLLWLLLPLLLVPAAPANEPHPAEQLVRETSEQVLRRLEAEKQVIENNAGRIYDIAKSIVLPHFDFERMSRWVLGRHWRDASEAQRKRFTEEFRQLLVRTYGRALAEYSGQEVRFLATRERGDDEAQVRTEVRQSGGPPIPIAYSMHRSEAGWQVYDVTIDGISLVTNYRSAFSSRIQQQGLDRLIELLAERNAAGGAS